MNAPRLIIIDNDPDRQKGLKQRIETYGNQVGIHSVSCREQVFTNEADDHRPGTHDLTNRKKTSWNAEWVEDLFEIDGYVLIFLHIGENKFNSKFFIHKCEEKGLTGRVIGYTGGNRAYWYNSSNYLERVGTGKMAANRFRFKEFFEDWHFNEQYNKERFDVPWNFRKLVGEDFIYLPVILMLCQCYLTVYAESEEYETNHTVGRALKRMGWERLKNVLPGSGKSLQIGTHFRQKKTVGDAAWFSDFFKKDDVYRDTLTQGIKNEWGSHQDENLAAIIKLIDAAYDKDGSNYTPSTVAGAYLAVAEKIGGNP